MSAPLLRLLAGPNGAGKSTLATRVLIPRTHLPFVNADALAVERWPDAPAEHAYEAARVAAKQREWLMNARRSFITETVFSHDSKVDLVARARSLGYLVYLDVVMVPVEVSVGRVEHRVRHGGHDVPEKKIRERHERLWAHVTAAREIADRTIFYDNASARHPYRVVATYEHGRVTREPAWPAWAPDALR